MARTARFRKAASSTGVPAGARPIVGQRLAFRRHLVPWLTLVLFDFAVGADSATGSDLTP